MNPDPALKSVISKGSMKEILLPSIMYLIDKPKAIKHSYKQVVLFSSLTLYYMLLQCIMEAKEMKSLNE